MADTTIQKQGEVFISQSEYDALRLAGNLQSNTKYHITKTPKTGVNSLEQMNLLNGDKTVDYNTTDGMTINGQARFTYDGGTTKDVTMNIDLPIVAGEGITIDKVNGQEKVEVKLDTALTDGKYVPLLHNEEQNDKVYIQHGNRDGTNSTRLIACTEGPYPSFIVKRSATGTMKCATPTADNDATTKKYVDDGFVKKVTTGNRNQAYTVDTNNQQAMMGIDEGASAWTLPRRYEDGRLQVGTPVGINDATTKAYVDGLHHYSHHIKLDLLGASVGSSSTASICMTVASKNAPNAVASLNDITVTTSLAYLLYYLGDESEGWEFSATGYIKHNGTMYMVYDLYVDIDYKIEASCVNLSTMVPANLVLTDINETWQVVDFVA